MPTPHRTARARRLGAVVAALSLTTGLAAFAVAGPATATSAQHSAPSARSQWGDASWGDPLADLLSLLNGKYAAQRDPGSLYTIENAIGARTVWNQTDAQGRQITGQGVTVALLDSGTAQVPGLDGAGKLTYGPDLSIEGNGALTDHDTYGHGTHLAGIIAAHDGNGPLTARSLKTLDPSVELGVAPDAELESLKLATTDGSTDVSQVIAALNWITEHQTNADGSRVRVVNLSFGTDSVQPYQLDPLAAAAENAWKHGLVVVVSGGNDGHSAPLTDPAIDPYVISVGASDGKDALTGYLLPLVASFSNGGTADRHVDLVAPGTSITSLRDPGSYIDQNHPEGMVKGDTTGRLFRGSGTSQAAAVVSGAVALLLQAYPGLTPDQVKGLLEDSAGPVLASSQLAGAGELNIAGALALAKKYSGSGSGGLLGGLGNLIGGLLGLGKNAPDYTQSFPASTGQGSIQAARAGDVLVDADGNPLEGEVDVQGNPWSPAAWWSAASTGTSWSGGDWLGVPWTGDGWSSTTSGSESARWTSARWTSARWTDADWDSARWTSARWTSARWTSARWTSARWTDDAWE